MQKYIIFYFVITLSLYSAEADQRKKINTFILDNILKENPAISSKQLIEFKTMVEDHAKRFPTSDMIPAYQGWLTFASTLLPAEAPIIGKPLEQPIGILPPEVTPTTQVPAPPPPPPPAPPVQQPTPTTKPQPQKPKPTTQTPGILKDIKEGVTQLKPTPAQEPRTPTEAPLLAEIKKGVALKPIQKADDQPKKQSKPGSFFEEALKKRFAGVTVYDEDDEEEEEASEGWEEESVDEERIRLEKEAKQQKLEQEKKEQQIELEKQKKLAQEQEQARLKQEEKAKATAEIAPIPEQRKKPVEGRPLPATPTTQQPTPSTPVTTPSEKKPTTAQPKQWQVDNVKKLFNTLKQDLATAQTTKSATKIKALRVTKEQYLNIKKGYGVEVDDADVLEAIDQLK